jgi:hypothetical protein
MMIAVTMLCTVLAHPEGPVRFLVDQHHAVPRPLCVGGTSQCGSTPPHVLQNSSGESAVGTIREVIEQIRALSPPQRARGVTVSYPRDSTEVMVPFFSIWCSPLAAIDARAVLGTCTLPSLGLRNRA